MRHLIGCAISAGNRWLVADVRAAAASPDGTRIATAATDGSFTAGPYGAELFEVSP